MKPTLLAGAVLAALLLCLSDSQGEEPADIPVPVPPSTAEPQAAAEPVSDPEPVAAAEPSSVAKPVSIAKPISETEPTDTDAAATPNTEAVVIPNAVLAPEMTLSPEPILTPGDDPVSVNPAEADRNDDGELTQRELMLQNHREQLEIYDLNNDNQISEDEWKAANKENRTRDEKFFLVDKDEDGAITEDEAVGFLMQRISLNSTYLDAKEESDDTDFNEREIQENAPSEVRVTLFSIPLGK